MTHMVAGYPDTETSFAVARGLIDGGASIIELQFPFSDPAADGPVIQAACSTALEAGFTLDSGFNLAERISSYSNVPVFIMTYANPVVTLGVDEFIHRAAGAGVKGIIAPDLVAGSDEGLYAAGKKLGMPIVPVVVPTITPERLSEIAALQEPYVYTALRQGITGRGNGHKHRNSGFPCSGKSDWHENICRFWYPFFRTDCSAAFSCLCSGGGVRAGKCYITNR